MLRTSYSIIALLLFAGCGASSDDTGAADRDPEAGMYDDTGFVEAEDTDRETTSDADSGTEIEAPTDGGSSDDTGKPHPGWGGRDTGVDTSAPATACNDGTDNDGDGWTDVLDPDCESGAEEVGYSDAACNDGEDNDGDGYADMEDPECITGGDTDELYA